MSQSKRNKPQNTASNAPRASVRPQRSQKPFYALLALIVLIGAGGIFYKIQSAPKPIVLSQTALLPKAEGYLIGKPDAPVTIMEFADFECPQCANFSEITEPDIRKRLIETGIANLRYYDFPIPELHPNTLFASLVASCAADQGKFWVMHDSLLLNQPAWEGRAHKNPKPAFDNYAKQIGLDMAAYNSCFDSRANVTRIQANQKQGLDYKVESTPSFVIGGVMYPGNIGYDRIKMLVDAETAKLGVKPDSGKAPPPK